MSKEQYNQIAKLYHDSVQDPNAGFWNIFIERPAFYKLLGKSYKGNRVLDIGCGSGIVTKDLHELGADISGIDTSCKLIEMAIKANSKIDYRVADASNLPYKDNEFDVVISSAVYHYMKNLDKAFLEVSRVIKNNGTFLFSMMHPFKSATERMDINGERRDVMVDYHTNKKVVKNKLFKNKDVEIYTHTFQQIFEALRDNGFVIEELIEPTPVASGEKVDKFKYDQTMKRPTFLVIKAIKK